MGTLESAAVALRDMVKKECGGDKSEERKEEEMRPIYYMSVRWGPVRDLSIHSRAKLRIQVHPQRKKKSAPSLSIRSLPGDFGAPLRS